MKLMHLSIKRKLYMTYLLGLALTVVFMLLVGFLAHGNRLVPPPAYEEDRNAENIMSYAFQFRQLNGVEEASRSINNAAINLRSLGDKNFMESVEFWDQADRSLRRNVAIVVLRNGDLLYQSHKLPDDIDLSLFPEFGKVDAYPNEYMFNTYETTIQRQIDYVSDEGNEISAFILFGIGSQTSKMFVVILNNLLIFMIVSTSIMGIISWFVVRSITTPLDKLKDAADEVRKGNLEHEVKHTTKDKIGELSDAFEAMRLQLLENENIREQYEANRRQMISSISHDLRTPVTAIKLHAEGIMDGVAGSPEKMSKYLKSMSSNAEMIDRLLKELTLFSNLDAEQECFQFSRINFCMFLEDLVEEWKYDYAKDDIRFGIDLKCEDDLYLKLDVIHFRRVLVNIMENAVKYVQSRPLEMTISLSPLDGYYRLILSDNGSGVPQEQLTQIFDRFHRVDEARQTSVPGSGLGLSIARQIVLKHNGRIWAENKPEGGLSIFIDMPGIKEAGCGTDSYS